MSLCICATWRCIVATSPFIVAIISKVAKADQARIAKATATTAIWIREPIVKRRRLLPSCRKTSRGLKKDWNLAPMAAFILIVVITFPGRPASRHDHALATAENKKAVRPITGVGYL